MAKYTNTDSGKFRECIDQTAAAFNVRRWVNIIYNDLNRKQNTRRLKASVMYGSEPFSAEALACLTAKCQGVFGNRFIKLKLVQYNFGQAVCLYLDDNKGTPFKPVPKPTSKARSRCLTASEKNAFWREALQLGEDDIVMWRTIYELKRDIPVFKKVWKQGGDGGLVSERKIPVIANLIIPAGTRVFITPEKCRAERAHVVSMFEMRSKKEVKVAYSGLDHRFKYHKDAVVKPRGGKLASENIGACGSGIHFFIDLIKAKNW